MVDQEVIEWLRRMGWPDSSLKESLLSISEGMRQPGEPSLMKLRQWIEKDKELEEKLREDIKILLSKMKQWGMV